MNIKICKLCGKSPYSLSCLKDRAGYALTLAVTLVMSRLFAKGVSGIIKCSNNVD